MLKQFNKFKQSMAGKNPQQIVQGMISSGQMSQSQFEQLKQMANELQGMLK